MSSRRQRSVPLGGRYGQVSLYYLTGSLVDDTIAEVTLAILGLAADIYSILWTPENPIVVSCCATVIAVTMIKDRKCTQKPFSCINGWKYNYVQVANVFKYMDCNIIKLQCVKFVDNFAGSTDNFDILLLIRCQQNNNWRSCLIQI